MAGDPGREVWKSVVQVQCEKTEGYRGCMEANYDGEEAGRWVK